MKIVCTEDVSVSLNAHYGYAPWKIFLNIDNIIIAFKSGIKFLGDQLLYTSLSRIYSVFVDTTPRMRYLIYKKWCASLRDMACHNLHVAKCLVGLKNHLCVCEVHLDLGYAYLYHITLSPPGVEDLGEQDVKTYCCCYNRTVTNVVNTIWHRDWIMTPCCFTDVVNTIILFFTSIFLNNSLSYRHQLFRSHKRWIKTIEWEECK